MYVSTNTAFFTRYLSGALNVYAAYDGDFITLVLLPVAYNRPMQINSVTFPLITANCRPVRQVDRQTLRRRFFAAVGQVPASSDQ
jgi:hypothetical protein